MLDRKDGYHLCSFIFDECGADKLKGNFGKISNESGDDVKPSWPEYTGLHMCYKGNYSKQYKSFLSSDGSLKLENLKTESPVIANHTSSGEQVLRLSTNRPSRSGSGFASSGMNGLALLGQDR